MSAPARSDVVGRWLPENGPDRAFVELRDNGDLAGHDGCNRFGGEHWSLEGDVVTTSGTRVSTLMACDGVDTWVGRAVSFRWDDGTLRATGPDGAELGLLLTDPDTFARG